MKPTTVHAASADVLEILFSDRNKAYQIRREYPDAMRKALMFMLLLIGAFVALAYRKTSVTPDKTDFEVISDWKTQIKLEEKKPPMVEPQPQEAPAAVKLQFKLLPPKLVSNTAIEPMEEPPTLYPNDIPDGAVVGTVTVSGEPGSPFSPPISGAGDGKKIVEDPAPTAIDDEPQTYVSVMPAFPGGEAELLRYLQASIKYPALAKATGVKGGVVLQFVVEKDGQITNTKILRDIGGGCGSEALRVLKAMPTWKPGNQNGLSVRVRMTLPVSFELK